MQIGMEPLVIDWAKEEANRANNSAYLRLLLIIQFLSRLCNTFLARTIALKECYLMNFEKKNHFTVFEVSVQMKFDGQTLMKCDFFGRSVTQMFFQEICSSGGKQSFSSFHCQKLPSSNILLSGQLFLTIKL